MPDPFLPFRPGFPGDFPIRPANLLQLDWRAVTRNMINIWLPEAVVSREGTHLFILQEDLCFNFLRRRDGGWEHRLTKPGVLSLTVTACGVEEGVGMSLALTNETADTWHEVHASVCVQFHAAPDFYDPERSRTFHLAGGELQAMQGPVRQAGGDACRFYGHPHLPEYARSDTGFAVIEAPDGSHAAAQWWEGASGAWGNAHPATLCVHTDPGFGTLPPGQTVVRRGMLALMRGNRHDALVRFRSCEFVRS